jgi:hypothetical protein
MGPINPADRDTAARYSVQSFVMIMLGKELPPAEWLVACQIAKGDERMEGDAARKSRSRLVKRFARFGCRSYPEFKRLLWRYLKVQGDIVTRAPPDRDLCEPARR